MMHVDLIRVKHSPLDSRVEEEEERSDTEGCEGVTNKKSKHDDASDYKITKKPGK